MAINLQKGQKIALRKGGTQDAPLRQVLVGLGWDEAPLSGVYGARQQQPIDCDASVILCGENGRVISSDIRESCVYYGNLTHSSGAIFHRGDNLTGAGDGDDEQIMVNLIGIPNKVARMVFVVNIYDARVRGQHFGMVRNAFIRLVDLDTGTEICRFNLSENYNDMTGLVVGEIYRKNGDWKFNAIGQPIRDASRLDAILRLYI